MVRSRSKPEPLSLSSQQEKKNDETLVLPQSPNQQLEEEEDGALYYDVAPPSKASNAIGLRVLARTPRKDAVNCAADDNDTNNARTSTQTLFDEPATTTPIKKKPPSSPISPQSLRITVSTISSNPSPLKNEDTNNRIQENRITTEQGSGGILNDIIEDAFCGMTLCGEFLGISDSDTASVKGNVTNTMVEENKIDKPIGKNEIDQKFLNDDSDHIKMQVVSTMDDKDRTAKEKRMKEMDDTFLGKMIQCVDVDNKCGAVGDSI